MKTIAAAIGITALASGASALLPILNVEMTNKFDAFKSEHGITFNSLVEEEQRLMVFIENMEMIEKHNERFAKGEETYELAMNEYTHLTFDEFKAKLNTFEASEKVESEHAVEHECPKMRGGRKLAASVDWRDHGAVGPVKNQAQCGSCWSFSTTGSIEGAHYLATGEMVSLSEQQLLNCVRDDWTCETGGSYDVAFDYVINVGGLITESEMPYTSAHGEAFGYCPFRAYNRYDKSSFAASIRNFAQIPHNDEMALASAVAQQPVSIAIDASERSFQFYTSGVYDPKSGCCVDCQINELDHAVLAVGYGSENGKDYWIVKNSWGTTWGDRGFVKMVRNTGKCGVAAAASYPIV